MWDSKYGTKEYFYGTNPNAFLKETNPFTKSAALLCLADGEGRNSVWLAEQGYNVTAIDLSIKGIEKGEALAKDRGVKVEFIHEDISTTDLFDRTWDGIISIFCHLPQPLRSKVHKQAVSSLKPKGLFLLEGYTPKQISYGTGGPKMVELLMNAPDLRKELTGLEFSICHEVEKEIYEGTGHNGLSHVTQIMGSKF